MPGSYSIIQLIQDLTPHNPYVDATPGDAEEFKKWLTSQDIVISPAVESFAANSLVASKQSVFTMDYLSLAEIKSFSEYPLFADFLNTGFLLIGNQDMEVLFLQIDSGSVLSSSTHILADLSEEIDPDDKAGTSDMLVERSEETWNSIAEYSTQIFEQFKADNGIS